MASDGISRSRHVPEGACRCRVTTVYTKSCIEYDTRSTAEGIGNRIETLQKTLQGNLKAWQQYWLIEACSRVVAFPRDNQADDALLCSDRLSGWTRWPGGGGAELPEQQVEDHHCLLWRAHQV